MRARNLKPGFFKNEILADCDPLARILFSGLWCMADREGRLEYRPKRIKAEVLPYDNCNIEELLTQLSSKGFIQKYSVNNENYIEIVSFGRHQNCHIKEAESTIPAPCKTGASIGNSSASPAESLLLNPESPIPLTEDYAKPEVSLCPHQEIISLYHELLPELPPVKIWNPQRQAILRARWTEDPDRQCMEWWREYFGRVRASPFLMGQEKEFRASLEWIIRPKNMPKVIEGFYAKRNGNGKRHAGIKAWLERENDETGQSAICQGDGSSGGDIRPGAGAVGI